MKKSSLKNKPIIIVAIILFFVLSTTSVGIVIYNNINNGNGSALFSKPMSTNSKIGVSYKVIGTVQRNVPSVCKDEGLLRYPVYGQTLTKSATETDADFAVLKQAILDENAYLNSAPDGTISGDCTNYNAMDANGYLYLNGERVLDKNGNHRQLYKHTASQNMYFGNVSDDQLAVIKQIAIQPRQTGNYITGLYAPAGEVIKLTISAADLQNVDGFYVYVGATLANGQANNVWLARDFVRMPVIANKMPVNANVCKYNEDLQTYTCYFGSYLGGPIYIGSPVSKNAFQVEIEGAVEYPHLICGLTTEKQYDDLLKSTAPYFDMEVFDNAFRFSGARTYSDNYTYAELCDSAVLWEKIALVSKQVPTGSNTSYGIDFLFEPFVAAGAAVAFVGRNTVNCPLDWMDDCLNVTQFVNSGSWGNVHEFNHHFQNFGLPNGGEVTNNAISLVEYSLFTKISSNRSLDDNALSGWNAYTDASRVLRMLLENSAKGDAVQSLDAYAMLLHSFGQDAFIQATKNGSGVDNWYKNLCEQTHYNLYYYFDELLHQTPSQDVANQIAQKGYPMYVPVASIYQTGTKYLYEGTQRHVNTMQPFEFLGDSYDFGILSNLHLPDGFTVTNVTVGNPQCGTIETLGNDSYRFVPNEKGISGDIDVTISLQKGDNAFAVKDVNLVFGFKQKQPTVAQRTSYYFDSDLSTIFEDIDDAVAKNYAGYTSKQTFDNTQGAQVWWDSEGVVANSITEYNCKIYLSKTDVYRFSIRGKNSNLYLSLDGVNYQLVARAGDVYNNKFDVCVQNGEYVDVQLEKGQTVYLRAVTMHFNTVFEGPSFVIGMGTVVDGASSLSNLSNSTAYNVSHQVEVFQTDYFYTRNYTADIVPPETDNTSTVISTNFSPWDDTTVLDNLFDGDTTNFMHNKEGDFVAEDTPFELTVDIGKVVQTNHVTMYGRQTNTQTPTTFKLYGGLTLDNMQLLCDYTDKPLVDGCNQTGDFALTQLRYYKLVVTKTNRDYICLRQIEFSVNLDAKLISPDDQSINYYGKWNVHYNLATFGHSYVTTDGYAEFEFTGTQFALLSKVGASGQFTISIDDGDDITCTFDGSTNLMFLCDQLQNERHKVVIKAITQIDIVALAVE